MIRKKRIKKNLRKTSLKVRKWRRRLQVGLMYLNSPSLKASYDKAFMDFFIYGHAEIKSPSFLECIKELRYKMLPKEYEEAVKLAKLMDEKDDDYPNGSIIIR